MLSLKTKCPYCESVRFEAVDLDVENYKFVTSVIRCAECKKAINTIPAHDTTAILKIIADHLKIPLNL